MRRSGVRLPSAPPFPLSGPEYLRPIGESIPALAMDHGCPRRSATMGRMNENSIPAPSIEVIHKAVLPLTEQQPSVVADGGDPGDFAAVLKAKAPLWPCKLRFKQPSYEKAGTSTAPAPEIALGDA